MGQPITVVAKPSSRASVVRYETNRSLTGMGHERYRAGDELLGNTPGIAGVHVYSNVVSVEFADAEVEGSEDIIAGLYLYWVEGVEVPSDAELT